MGLSLRFLRTFLRSCSRTARSLDISSALRSESVSGLRGYPMGELDAEDDGEDSGLESSGNGWSG